MKILLIEYITAGGFCNQPLPDSLLREGMLMRDALLTDFSELANVEVFTSCDARVSLPKYANVAMVVDETSNVIDLWKSLLQKCDAALIIAPESNGILGQLTQLVDTYGVVNLGSKSVAVNLFSNKYETYHALNHAKILTIPTYTASEFLHTEFFKLNPVLITLFNKGCVAKPIDGAGCGDTYFFHTASALILWLNESAQLSELMRYIVQPFQAGLPTSISMLCKAGSAWVLSCNEQLVEINLELGQKAKQSSKQDTNQASNRTEIQELPVLHAPIRYMGSLVNGLFSQHVAFSQLAQIMAHAFPDLNGYVGIDVIINCDEIYVVEVNPRITTSYIALHESLNVNPAKLILDLAEQQALTFKLPENMAANKVLININE